jgi:hypothetical protein
MFCKQSSRAWCLHSVGNTRLPVANFFNVQLSTPNIQHPIRTVERWAFDVESWAFALFFSIIVTHGGN